MRNLFILTLFVVFAFNSFAQTAQPVRITNFGTATRDEVRKLRQDIDVTNEVLKSIRVEALDADRELNNKIVSLNDRVNQSNELLQKQYDSRWGAWEVIFLGMFFLAVLFFMLWALAENYLRPLQQQSDQQRVTPPVPPTTDPEREVIVVSVVMGDEDEEMLFGGDRASENAIIIKGNSGNVTINIGTSESQPKEGDKRS